MLCSGSAVPLDPYDDMINRSINNKLKIQPIVGRSFGITFKLNFFECFSCTNRIDCMADGGLAAIERDLETLIAGFECEAAGINFLVQFNCNC